MTNETIFGSNKYSFRGPVGVVSGLPEVEASSVEDVHSGSQKGQFTARSETLQLLRRGGDAQAFRDGNPVQELEETLHRKRQQRSRNGSL